LIIAGFLGAAGYFAGLQALWVDETTQLSGLALPLSEQLSWLLHRTDPGLGVPPDRMPPISYWLGSLWGAVFGLTETSLRWFGIACILAAAPALYLAGRRVGGAASGRFMLASALWAPGIIAQAVEIRAYPPFFAFAAWATCLFASLVFDTRNRSARWGKLIALGAVVVLATYTHFFGIVFGACLFAALLADRLATRGPVLPVLAVGTGTALICAGVAPFALAAVALSSDAAAAAAPRSLGETLSASARLAVRTFAHSSHFIHLAVATLLAAGLVGLFALSVTMPARTKRLILLAPLLVAFPVLAGLNLVISGFDVLAVHYNIWMVPIAALFLSAPLAAETNSWHGRLARSSAALVVAAQLAATTLFVLSASYFTHGPGEWVADTIDEPARTLVIHDPNGPWAHVYFPIHFLHGSGVTHILAVPGAPQRITAEGLSPLRTAPETFAAGFATVLHVSTRNRDTAFLTKHIRNGESCGGGVPPVLPGLEPPQSSETYCAFIAATLARSTASVPAP